VGAFFFTSASGWIATLLIAAEILLPYLLRRSWLSERLGVAEGFAKPYLVRMWPHYWAGYALLAISFAHAWVPMRAGYARGANAAGLWIATATLGGLLLQAALGLGLKDPKLQVRTGMRRSHYWLMVAIGAGVMAHIALNR
jgi:hypothetical protein